MEPAALSGYELLSMVLVFIGLVWAFLLILIPFFIFGMSATLKRIERQLIENKVINSQILEHLEKRSEPFNTEKIIIPD